MPTPSTRASSAPRPAPRPGPHSAPHPADVAEHLIAVTGRVRRSLREVGPDTSATANLTMSQEAVVGHLVRGGPRTTADLARLEGVRPQSMGLTIAALDDLGLVAKTPDPDDVRRSLVDLTGAGRAIRASTRSTRVETLARRFDERLHPNDLATIERALHLLDGVVADDTK